MLFFPFFPPSLLPSFPPSLLPSFFFFFFFFSFSVFLFSERHERERRKKKEEERTMLRKGEDNGSRVIREGDGVILYVGADQMSHVRVTKGAVFQNKFGIFPHETIIGARYGSKIVSKTGKGWIYALLPTPDLWTSGAVTHRTQIIYSTDISAITFHLQLRPGSIVVESGTGTGSLSTAIARSIAPNGRLHTFEFHEQRAEAAREDFRRNGLDGIIVVRRRDAIGEGFEPKKEGEEEEEKIVADAVFLDLPSPWVCLEKQFVQRVLRPHGRFCSFSPCIEQVQLTCDALRKANFYGLYWG